MQRALEAGRKVRRRGSEQPGHTKMNNCACREDSLLTQFAWKLMFKGSKKPHCYEIAEGQPTGLINKGLRER